MTSTTSTARAKRLSWQERRDLADKQFAERQAQFEPTREAAWVSIWARVLRMYVLVSQNPDFARDSDWWCEPLSVDAENETFKLDSVEGTAAKASLTFHQHEQALNSLSTGERLAKDYLVEKERKRLAELERQRLRQQGLAKLTDEECTALGLGRSLDDWS